MAERFGTVAVVGLGTMGAGIVEVFARHDVRVIAVEADDVALARGRGHLTRSTDRAVDRGRLAPAERDALLARVRFAVGVGAAAAADLVVEAVPERLELKRRVFADLDAACRPGAVLATNTSSLSVTELAAATGRPERVVGLHFFNPAPVMRLVEVIRTPVTADDVVADVTALCARLDKVAVTVGDRAGFVANALLFGYLNRAVTMLDERHARREDIDTAMRLGAGLPMGPLALLDLIGLDTGQEILHTMYRRGGRDRRHAPAPLLTRLVAAGRLGRKTGRGFYTYARPGGGQVEPDGLTPPPAGSPPAGPGPVGVVGAGPAGAAVAAAFAASGCPVIAAPGPDGRLAGAEFVIEVDPVDPVQLGAVCRPGTVLATAASATAAPVRSVIEWAVATGRPADVVGLRLTLTGAGAALAELAGTVRSAPSALAAARGAAAAIGATVVECRDRAGFLVDGLLLPYLNDAVRMLAAGYATADDIDVAMTLGCGYPAGPIAMLDALGAPAALAGQAAIHRELGEPGMAPEPLLAQVAAAGLGARAAARTLVG